ncbi:glutathione synthase [Candidatus Endoriftia persephonae]|jgi:glutathione synthase|uniref:Glutathione synthetase n=2 Tax=Gammaproteobacteria TaxID=1236 RepID=G2FJD4_9GAMM|nr:glutathione synthase [Candidatus Endoriftia persephone]EGW53081.1 glutathione synthase [endosymbiont of Tevnia jerichonana (vent Tica)]USF88237.1 glutathione synthase [Candidatus Endoriftia persephone]
MNTTLGVIMDPIESIKVQKDSTFAMLLAAQHRGWELLYMEQGDLSLSDGVTYARMRPLRVRDNASNWYQLGDQRQAPLDSLDVVLMRKDPPFDMEYIYTTYLLEQAEHRGCLVVNRPQALRDANEKLFTSEFNDCTPPTLVSRSAAEIRSFLDQHQDIILKPLGGMGGASVFRVRRDDPNTSVIIETLTLHGTQFTMAQQFIPEISAGDKRILMIDGEAVPYALARIPAKGETRGNLAAGGRGEGQPLSERDQWIAAQVGPELKRRGILFAGLDVIGNYLTEINVTSPTCIRELDRQFNLDIAGDLMDRIAERLQ